MIAMHIRKLEVQVEVERHRAASFFTLPSIVAALEGEGKWHALNPRSRRYLRGFGLALRWVNCYSIIQIVIISTHRIVQ